MTRIKVCGITRLEDLDLALELGVDAVGFNFVRGTPRALDEATARALCVHARGRTARVGVFQDAPLAHVQALARELELEWVQLHGDEPPAYADAVGPPVIKAVRADARASSIAQAYPSADLLLDHPSGGGSGRTWDLDAARPLLGTGRRVWLAGGLRPDNVGAVIAAVQPFAVQPFGVDACSGLEARPGVKDPDAVRAFVHAVRDVAPGSGARLEQR